MRFGISIPRLYDPQARNPYEQTYALCLLAEDLGFDFACVGHHCFSPQTGDESAPFTFLAAIAARTSAIRLVTGIFLLPLYHPAVVAEQLATLDVISNGRAIMGVGVGYRPYEFESFGLDIRTRGARMDESMAMIRKAFTTGSWQHEGRFWTMPDVPIHPAPIQTGGPPMWVGGVSDAALRRAARLGDGWMSDNIINIDGEAERAQFYRDACAEAGRPVGEICILRTTWCAPTRQEAEDAVMPHMRAHLAEYGKSNAGSGTLPYNGEMMMKIARGEHVPVEEFTRGQALAGTPDDLNVEVAAWRDKVSADSMEMMITGPKDFESLRAMLTLLGKEVLPNFR